MRITCKVILLAWTAYTANGFAVDVDNDGLDDSRDPQPFVPASHLALGHNHSCGLLDGDVSCWGSDYYGQSSVPNILSQPSQVVAADQNTCVLDQFNVTCFGVDGRDVFPVNGGKQVSTGGFHVCVIDKDGLWCYRGGNYFGELEIPTDLDHPLQVAAGLSHTCALTESGIRCWGSNDFGESDVPRLDSPSWVTTGANFTCALDRREVICWGINNWGQLEIPTLLNPVYVEAGHSHACAIDDGGLICWGRNSFQQATPPSLVGASHVAPGTHHSCALDDNGVSCWGFDAQGQSTVPDHVSQGRTLAATVPQAAPVQPTTTVNASSAVAATASSVAKPSASFAKADPQPSKVGTALFGNPFMSSKPSAFSGFSFSLSAGSNGASEGGFSTDLEFSWLPKLSAPKPEQATTLAAAATLAKPTTAVVAAATAPKQAVTTSPKTTSVKNTTAKTTAGSNSAGASNTSNSVSVATAAKPKAITTPIVTVNQSTPSQSAAAPSASSAAAVTIAIWDESAFEDAFDIRF